MVKKLFSRPGLRLLAVLLAAAVLFALGCVWAAPEPEADIPASEYAEYERGKVVQILSDTSERDDSVDRIWRGTQLMLVEVTTGQYKGETLQAYNYVGPIYGGPQAVGDGVVLLISTYADGSHYATVHEYDRLTPLAILVTLFLLVTVLIGGKTGAKSLVGLGLTLLCLFYILIPALFKGAPTILTVLAVCCYISVVTLCIMSGVRRKTLCAIGGTIAGVVLAALFGLLAQHMTQVDGLRAEDAEALLQIQQSGGAIRLRGLLVGGFILSALGAVMDVAMGIASSVSEIHNANPGMDFRALFRSGMNVGRDMVGTMTNTLILAFLGSSFTLILYIYSLSLQPHQLISSALVTTEVIGSLSSSIGVILAIPITAALSALALGKKK